MNSDRKDGSIQLYCVLYCIVYCIVLHVQYYYYSIATDRTCVFRHLISSSIFLLCSLLLTDTRLTLSSCQLHYTCTTKRQFFCSFSSFISCSLWVEMKPCGLCICSIVYILYRDRNRSLFWWGHPSYVFLSSTVRVLCCAVLLFLI